MEARTSQKGERGMGSLPSRYEWRRAKARSHLEATRQREDYAPKRRREQTRRHPADAVGSTTLTCDRGCILDPILGSGGRGRRRGQWRRSGRLALMKQGYDALLLSLHRARSRDESLRLRKFARRALGQSELPESALKVSHEHAVPSLAGAALLTSSATSFRCILR